MPTRKHAAINLAQLKEETIQLGIAKVVATDGHGKNTNKRVDHMANDMLTRAGDLFAAITTIYEDTILSRELVLFGDAMHGIPDKIELIADNPWDHPWFPAASLPSDALLDAIAKLEENISGLPLDYVERTWITHQYPRHIRLAGTVVRQQMVGSRTMEHEICSIIIRRISHVDAHESNSLKIDPWRVNLEPDFATTALSGLSCSSSTSVRRQLIKDNCSARSCWMIHAPLALDDGWCNFTFEMPNKIIHIMDPTAGPRGLNGTRRIRLTIAADVMLEALFSCLESYFIGWQMDASVWSKEFPIFMDTKYPRELSGLCVTYFVANFDGHKLRIGMSKNLAAHRQNMLYNVLCINDNMADLAGNIIATILDILQFNPQPGST